MHSVRSLLLAALLVCSVFGGTGVGGALGHPADVSESEAGGEPGQNPPPAPDVEVSRNQTVVGAPVTFRVTDATGPVEWSIQRAPRDSDATLHDPTDASSPFRPDVAGTYVVTVRTDAERGPTRDTVTLRVDPRSALLERYAPRLHFREGTKYKPTRVEALLEHSRLLREAGRGSPFRGFGPPGVKTDRDDVVVAENLSVFDLADRNGSHYIELTGQRTEYPEYEEAYPPTVYGHVDPTATFRNRSYTAVTYYFIATFDPKRRGARYFQHEYDIESVTVLVNESGPQWVGASAHGGGEVREWETTPRAGSHLELYPSSGSHAGFFADTTRYDGDGYQVQGYGASAPSNDGGNETDPFLSALHSERTGSAVTWTHDGSRGTDYEIATLTGREVWASYAGSPNIPQQRLRFEDAGAYVEQEHFPDWQQRDATVTVGPTRRIGDRVETTAVVGNWGPKPHPFWVTVEATAPDGSERVLTTRRVRVGTDSEQFVRRDVPVPLPEDSAARLGGPGDEIHTGSTQRVPTTLAFELPREYDGNWSLTVEVWNYGPAVREPVDRQDSDPLAVPPSRPTGAPDWQRRCCSASEAGAG